MGKFKSCRKSILYDMRVGLFQQRKRYIILVCLIVLFCFYLNKNYLYYQSTELVEDTLSLGDYLFFFFSGMRVYVYGDQTFKINVIWLILNIYLSYLISDYPFRDLKGYGQQVLFRVKNRQQWWFSKCIWCVASVILFYLFVFLISFICVIITGDISLQPHQIIQQYITKMDISKLTNYQIVTIAILLPMIISIALSLLQLFISLVIHPLAGFILITILLVLSIYFTTPMFLGNYLMLMRSNLILQDGSLTVMKGLAHCGIVIFFSLLGGVLIINKKDILA